MKFSRSLFLPIAAIALTLSSASFADNQRRIDIDSKVVTQHKAKINNE